MRPSFPFNAEEIHLTWPIKEGGLGVTASTDDAGNPYIGLYSLNSRGEPTGWPSRFRRARLMANVVAGFMEQKPITVFIDAEVTMRGLGLTVSPPPFIVVRGYERHKFMSWDSEAPRYAMAVSPVNSNWPLMPWAKEKNA